MVYGNADQINTKGKRIFGKDYGLKGLFSSEQIFYQVFTKSLPLNGLAFLIPKKAFSLCGVFNTEYRFIQDADMWYRLMLAGYSFLCHRDVIASVRVHAGRVSLQAEKDWMREQMALVNSVAENSIENDDTRKMIAVWRWALANNNILLEKIIRSKLKQQGDYSFDLSLKRMFYLLHGRFISFLKFIYHSFYKNKIGK